MRAPSPRTRPVSSRAAALWACALGGLLLLAARPDRVAAGPALWPRLAPADTDSVATPTADALLAPPAARPVAGFLGGTDTLLVADTTEADTTDADSTARARAYFPTPIRTGASVSLVPRWLPGVRGRLGTYWRREVSLDTAAYAYRIRETVGDADVRAPAVVSLEDFLAARRTEAIGDQFRTLAAQRASQRQARSGGGLGFAVDIPGGNESPFRTIFGKNEVALTVNGTSNVNLGIRYDRNDLQDALRPNSTPFAPDFGQELNLNVAGTIGDKVTINVNYDTQSQFDFENQVSFVYEGYEDDILQRFEAGNVFLQTPATLIRGGQRLFGLRTDFQFGPLALTAVASQQDAETVDRTFEGGADAQTFQLAPYDYEDNTHYFLGYAFHNWWDRAHERPQNPQLPPGFRRFVGIEVWKHEPGLINSTQENIETTWAVALADLGEPPEVLAGGEAYLGPFNPATGRYANEAAPLPDPREHQYTPALLDQIRADGATFTAQTLEAVAGIELPTAGAFSNNVFRRLRANVDYAFDPQLGWLSLTASLTDSDLLAVAYQYERFDGQIVTVGDYGRPAQAASQTGPRTILKLIRADRPTPTDPLWDLTLRNIYRVGGRNLNQATFQLGITYKPSGASASASPPVNEVSFDQRTFLEVLGLDRVNEQGLATPDDVFDFRSGVTVNPDAGRVIFPVRQPFGDYLYNLIETGWTVGSIGDPADGGRIAVSYGVLKLAEALERYVPRQADGTERGETLYDLLPTDARRRLPRLSDYRVTGEFKSATQSVFNIGFALVEGTVRVTSGELELREGTDYRVNYTAGTVEIINPQYLLEGQRVQVSVEQNKFFSIGSKTLLGLRADYRVSEDIGLGATWMRLSERPLGDKFRVGEEALDNSIVGLDGSFRAEPRWLTRAIDALPLLQTRAPSRIELRGEVARLDPGSPTTQAFSRTRAALREAGVDFADDELAGVSYVDDFEGSENAYTALRFVDGWQIAAAPREGAVTAGPPGARDGSATEPDVTDPALRSNWRGLFTWYSINEGLYGREPFANLVTPATEPIPAVELFPQRQFPNTREAERPIDLLDLYFDPTRRGPYNYNGDLGGVFQANPEDVWGGFVRPIESSYSNFDGQNNIEFVELLVSPLGGPDGTRPVGPNAVMYLDLGRVQEDVLPNGFLNSEDGIQSGDLPPGEDDALDAWGRRPIGRTNGFVDFFEVTRRTEDLGLDGLPSTTDLSLVSPYPVSEREFFDGFLRSVPAGTAEEARSVLDPSADDFRNFLDDAFNDTRRYPTTAQGASIQERYGHYYPARELNSALAQSNLGDGQGNSVIPNSEDINGNNTLDPAEAFHRYAIPLDQAALLSSPFFLNTLETTTLRGETQQWYLLRIPVRTQAKEAVNIDDDDFSRIEAVRVWTTGHDKPATIRIASFELVGSQWLKSEEVGFLDEGAGDDPGTTDGAPPQLFIESVNNEENGSIYAIPKGTIQNTARNLTGAIRTTREQALVFRAEGLPDGRRAGIARSYATNALDLTKYSNVRAAIHGHGFDRADSMRVFVRLGDDETQNYYELEQPVYPFDPSRLGNPAEECGTLAPFNCAASDSLWQTNVPVGGGQVADLNPINIPISELNRAKLERDRLGLPSEERFTLTDVEGAPPGARITVRGQPSVQDVRTVVLGVRNGPGGRAVVDTATVWFNELRVTGYDEAGGASGFLAATLALADVASLNARVSFTDDGFGELGGALGGRGFAQQTALTLTSTFNADKLLPERFGWTIPVTYSLTQNASTPRFDPDNGDVRLDDLVAQAREAEAVEGNLDPAFRADQILDRARTETASQNFRVSASKRNSRSPWLKYTLDGLQATYSRSVQSGANPSTAVNESDAWTGALNYRMTVPRPLAVRPFWLADGVPVLGSVLGGLRLNLLPQTVALSTDARRSLSATQQRLGADFLSEPDSVSAFRALPRRTQRFEHGRQVDVQYKPLSFLDVSFGTNTDQDFGAAGQREAFRVLVRERTGGFARVYDLSPSQARDTTSVVYQDLLAELDGFSGGGFPNDRVEVLGGQDLTVLPLGTALGNVFGGDVRTRQYQQQATAALRVSTRRVAWLRWLQLQPLTVSADYTWRDQPSATAPDLKAAAAGATALLQSSVRVAPRTLFRLFPFYRGLEEARTAGRAPADSSGGGFRPLGLVRDLFLGLTSVDDISLTYRGTSRATTGGLDGSGFSLFSAFSGTAPPLGYRLGLTREIDPALRLTDDRAFNTFFDDLGTTHDLDARTQFQPLSGLSIGLTWRTAWNETERIDYEIAADGGPPTASPGRRTGTGLSTVFAFGGDYEAFVRRHAARFDPAAVPEGGVVVSEFLSPTGLAEDFTAELSRGLGRFGPNALFAVPLPNWTVTYGGLERLPLVGIVANQISLQHGYSATSETGFASILDPSARRYTLPVVTDLTFAGAAALADGVYDEPTSVTVTERFQPLIGVNAGLKGGIQASVTANRTSLFTLSTPTASLFQRTTRDLRLDLSFSRTGLRLLGLRGVNNQIRFQLTALVANDRATRDLLITDDVVRVLRGQDFVVPEPQETSRFQLSPQLSYTVSQQVTANLIAQYERTNSEVAGQTDRFTGGISLRILFSN